MRSCIAVYLFVLKLDFFAKSGRLFSGHAPSVGICLPGAGPGL
jgi:hypothetical protein